jgi:hypothetical protein
MVVVTLETSGSNWQMWTAIATVATVVMLFFAALFAGLQVKSARKSTDTQLVVGLYERFYTPETAEVLRSLYPMKPEDVQNLPRYKMDKIYIMLNWFDIMGVLMIKGTISDYMAVEAFGGGGVLRCWHILSNYIMKVRERRGSYYCKGVEYFARCTVKYQIRNSPRNQWIKFYPGPLREREVVNLIEEEMKEPHLLSKCELRMALFCRIPKVIWNKELREELCNDKEFRSAFVKSFR